MKLIVITPPESIPNEHLIINRLFEEELQSLHIRKPSMKEEEMEEYLQKISPIYRQRIVVHDHHSLMADYRLQGIHLNHRHPTPPEGYNNQLSCSCHSFGEVTENKEKCSYLFLSPIFDSISKAGYHSDFSEKLLQRAKNEGIIDEKVIAVGGINAHNIAIVKRLGFGGVALLGDIWNRPADQIVSHFKEILKLCQ